MGNSCMQKSRDMMLTLISAAHVNTARVLSYYKAKKEGYEYKGASINDNDFDYERDILLDEDADDFNAFDYEEQSDLIVINAPAPQYKSRQEMIQEQKDKNAKTKSSSSSSSSNNKKTTTANNHSSSSTSASGSNNKKHSSKSEQSTCLLDYGNTPGETNTQNDNSSINLKIGWEQDKTSSNNNSKSNSNHSSNSSQQESQPLNKDSNTVDPQEEYDTINDVMDEIQQNINTFDGVDKDHYDHNEERLDDGDDNSNLLLQYAFTNNNNTKQQDSANFTEDHDADALMQDIDNMIKYDEDDDDDDDEEAGILDRV